MGGSSLIGENVLGFPSAKSAELRVPDLHPGRAVV